MAVDALGGDRAPEAPVEGAALAAARDPSLRIVLLGPGEEVSRLAAARPALAGRARVVDAPEGLPPGGAAAALRRGRGSSMARALELVRAGEARAMVTAGDTGAFMALARATLAPTPGVRRPAAASFMPTPEGASVFLDLGATLEDGAGHLVDLAVMGSAFAEATLGIAEPSVALLNVGEEEGKGRAALREAAAELSRPGAPVRFAGFAEGHEISAGRADVIVADGFSGNVALKTAEGIAKMHRDALRAALSSSPRARLAAALLRGPLRRHLGAFDPRRYNGAALLGVEGLAVKSHGRLDAEGFSRAVEMAARLAGAGLPARIREAARRRAAGAPPGAPGG